MLAVRQQQVVIPTRTDLSLSPKKPGALVDPYIYHLVHKTSFLAAVRVYWFICHSISVPFSASVFPLISKRRIVILGPTSASSTDCHPVRTKTWCRTSILSKIFLNVTMRLPTFWFEVAGSRGGKRCLSICTTRFPRAVVKPSNMRWG